MGPGRRSIGVVLCTFQGEAFLAAQLRSVFAQTRPPDRVLVLDDGSRDDTLRIVREFQTQHPEMRIQRNETRLGYAANFEKGLRLCDTDLIALCDQDDIWLPERLEALCGELESHPGAGLAFSNAEYMTADGSRTGQLLFTPGDPFPVDESIVRREIIRRRRNIHGHLIVLEADFRQVLIPNAIMRSHGHDSWICLNAFFLRRTRYLPDALSLYRLHPHMTSGYRRALRGTPFEYHRQLLDWQRQMRNLRRAFVAPFTRAARRRGRVERACNLAEDMLMLVDRLLMQRRALGLPDPPSSEREFLEHKFAEWRLLLETAGNGPLPARVRAPAVLSADPLEK